ncbi:MAG: rod shape-determining protein RodA [Eubacteriales bacterium]|nr:rod shape-determining protein RodA [Eubacteriales bacterium]
MNYFLNLIKNIDKVILSVVAILAVISIVMIGSTSYDGGFVFTRDVIVQTAAYIIGFVALIVVLSINYTFFNGLEKYLYIASVILLLLVYIPGLGVESFGARSWIDLKITTFQPSEIVKIFFVLIMAGYLDEHKDDLYNFKGLIKAGIVAAPIILIVLKEDLGSALVFAAIWVAMVFFAGIDYKVFAKFFALFLAAIPVAYTFLAPYQKERIEAFLHPSNLSLQGNYQVWQSKVAIGSGGIFGKGLFKGTQKELDFIPVQKSDFIFSVIGEELGLIGGIGIIGLFTILLIRLTKIVRDAVDFYGALIVVGFIGMFAFQIFENIAMTMGIMPVTGITLPFLSYGGSSIISNMIAVAFVLDIGMRSKTINF